ncbi:hypothetical protein IL38_23765 [Actinopolyspora erythraea]|uniref:CYTH domain-containing protein n=1 Tax=Actinopolyspora erythraea TaxID=414996 RepID=A0ABR4WY61_9ACTN|nr:hypothetical protein [Actinopolyspora erythraea]KGI79330.1 hypothetical protein IL38_23765 [Actinopolyspora erythraea]
MRDSAIKILTIDPVEFGATILHNGGSLVADRALYHQWELPVPGDEDQWIRLRTTDDGSGVLSAHHRLTDETATDSDAETPVGDVPTMLALLARLGHHPARHWEHYRTRYLLPTEHDPVNIDVVEWPRVPAWAAVDGQDTPTVLTTIRRLGEDPDAATTATAVDLLADYGLTCHHELTFTTERIS